MASVQGTLDGIQAVSGTSLSQVSSRAHVLIFITVPRSVAVTRGVRESHASRVTGG